jgi:hypothetical protein
MSDWVADGTGRTPSEAFVHGLGKLRLNAPLLASRRSDDTI